MRSLLRRLRGLPAGPPPIDDERWRRLVRRVEPVRRLGADERDRLRGFCAAFLADKSISAVAGLRLDEDRRITLAALCCLPVLHLGFDWLDGWRELIVYPGQFRVRRHHHDEDSGVVEEWDDDLAGEAWDRGPVVVSWADVRADLREPESGCNVLVHEIAHKLDVLDGSMDGMPPLPDARRRQAWIAAFQPAFDGLRQALEAQAEQAPGEDATAIDPYAAESPDEFFAVVSEYHFSAPQVLRAAMPAVAAELAAFYGPSPMDGVRHD